MRFIRPVYVVRLAALLLGVSVCVPVSVDAQTRSAARKTVTKSSTAKKPVAKKPAAKKPAAKKAKRR